MDRGNPVTSRAGEPFQMVLRLWFRISWILQGLVCSDRKLHEVASDDLPFVPMLCSLWGREETLLLQVKLVMLVEFAYSIQTSLDVAVCLEELVCWRVQRSILHFDESWVACSDVVLARRFHHL